MKLAFDETKYPKFTRALKQRVARLKRKIREGKTCASTMMFSWGDAPFPEGCKPLQSTRRFMPNSHLHLRVTPEGQIVCKNSGTLVATFTLE